MVYCECCHYETSDKSNMKRHLKGRIHKHNKSVDEYRKRELAALQKEKQDLSDRVAEQKRTLESQEETLQLLKNVVNR